MKRVVDFKHHVHSAKFRANCSTINCKERNQRKEKQIRILVYNFNFIFIAATYSAQGCFNFKKQKQLLPFKAYIFFHSVKSNVIFYFYLCVYFGIMLY